MDTPIVTSLFRQLFRHRPCLRRHGGPLSIVLNGSSTQRRTIIAERDDVKRAAAEGEWHPKSPFLHIDMSEEFKRYPLVTAAQLAHRKERPRRVKMLVRDYIDGCFLFRAARRFVDNLLTQNPAARLSSRRCAV
jgi:hypothetical protein